MKQWNESFAERPGVVWAVLLLFVSAVFTSGCNGDVFITKLRVSAANAEVSRACPEWRIGVSGKNWTVKDINFYGREDYIYFAGVEGDAPLRIQSPYVDLYVRTGSDYIDIELADYVGSATGTLSFTVTDGYDYIPVEVSVEPDVITGVNIEDVSYTLDSWGGYPDENYTEKVITYNYPNGLSEAGLLEFRKPESCPIRYYFIGIPDASFFAQRVLESRQEVPIPSYTFHSSPTHDFWGMTGDRAVLTTEYAQTITKEVPPVPAPVELPASTPLTVTLWCDYEAVSLQCRIRAVNETSGERDTISCVLRMWVPVKFNATVEKK